MLVLGVALFTAEFARMAFVLFAASFGMLGVIVCRVGFGVGAFLRTHAASFVCLRLIRGIVGNFHFVGELNFFRFLAGLLFLSFAFVFLFFFEFGPAGDGIDRGVCLGFFLFGFNEAGGKSGDVFFAQGIFDARAFGFACVSSFVDGRIGGFGSGFGRSFGSVGDSFRFGAGIGEKPARKSAGGTAAG
jgi:hypothetical protein